MSDSARTPRLSLIAAVVAIAGVPIVASLFNLATPFFPYGRFGFTTAGNGTITSVLPASAAAQAHIKAGDRLDMDALTPQQRVYARWSLTIAGTRSDFLFSKGPARSVILVARRPAAGRFSRFAYFAIFWIMALADIAVVLMAALLVLALPSRMTWAFLLYAAGSMSGSPILTALMSPAWVAAFSACIGVLWCFSFAGLIAFALRFPSNRVAGVGAVLDRMLAPIAVALAVSVIVANVGLIYRGMDTDAFEDLLTSVAMGFYCLAIAIFVARYFSERLYERSRMAWVIASFLVAYAGTVIVRICEAVGFVPPREVVIGLLALTVAVPIAVAYAILKQRVISVRFFVNKALIVAVLAALSIGSIAILDWLVSALLGGATSEKRAALLVGIDVAAVVVLTILLRALYETTRDTIERIFFRREYHARRYLMKLAQSFSSADSPRIIGDELVQSIAAHLQLSSVAVFARGDGGGFRREAAAGWTDEDVLESLDAQRLASAFEKRPTALPFTDLRLVGRRIPSGDAEPVVGFPIFVGGRLSRFVLFSGHPYGLDLDPSERRLLGNVTRAASHGFARLSQL